jgi:signal transduction histidine kinase
MPNASDQRERLETIGSVAAGIAHDINNQLTLILNHLEMQDREAVREAVTRCGDLTGSLLAYARGERSELQPLDLSAFLRNFVAQLRLPKGIHLVSGIPFSLPLIAADPLTLERALMNLISNACAAMGSVGILRIGAIPNQIQISDTGPGIAPENAQRIFEPFFTTKGKKGTGLGLSIVRDIMRQHCGSVTVRPGRGAEFTLRFRAARITTQGKTGLSASPRKIAPAA